MISLPMKLICFYVNNNRHITNLGITNNSGKYKPIIIHITKNRISVKKILERLLFYCQQN